MQSNHRVQIAVAAAPAQSQLRDEIGECAALVLAHCPDPSQAERQLLKDLQRSDGRYRFRSLEQLARLAARCPEDTIAYSLADRFHAFADAMRTKPQLSIVRALEAETEAQADGDRAQVQAALAQNDPGLLMRAERACLSQIHRLERLADSLRSKRQQLVGATLAMLLIIVTACSSADAKPPVTKEPTAPVQGAGIARIDVLPRTAAVPITGLQPFRAEVFDSSGVLIPTPSSITWSFANATVGTLDLMPPGTGAMFRAGPTCTADVRARIGTIVGSSSVTVTP